MRVIVCDDNVDAAAMLGALMEFEHYETRVCHDGRSCLDLAPSFRPDVVLLDIGMPQLDGYAVARALRAMEAGKTCYLIAVTGYTQYRDRKAASDAGFDLLIPKGTDPTQLLDAVKARAGLRR